jgi:UDP-N-acetylmuramoyl-L-alanyl-D-glutamate--2,6-diaminopimelate ligase
MYKKIKTSFLNSGNIKIISPKDTNLNILPGKFNNINAETAVKVVEKLGFSKVDAINALQSFELPLGRLEKIENNEGIDIYIDFAHTPDSLNAVLMYLKGITKGKLIAVFGCAGERDKLKRPKMGKIASEQADIVVLTAEDPRSESVNEIIQQITSGIKNNTPVYVIPEREKAIKKALEIANRGDTVGLFGKGHERSMNLNGIHETPWSEHKIVRKYLKEQ